MQHSQSEIIKFEYGKNIIDLQNTCPNFWEIETVSMPNLNLRDKIDISHPKIERELEIIKLNFIINEFGFIRTKITAKED